jgi:hypothetical protein
MSVKTKTAIDELPRHYNYANHGLYPRLLADLIIQNNNFLELSFHLGLEEIHFGTNLKSVEHYYRIRDKLESLMEEFE